MHKLMYERFLFIPKRRFGKQQRCFMNWVNFDISALPGPSKPDQL